MRKITELSVNAFYNDKAFSQSKMKVVVNDNVTCLLYHGNVIATKGFGIVTITNAGWFSNTTKKRLNAILSLYGDKIIYQKDFVWYLDGKKRDGTNTAI